MAWIREYAAEAGDPFKLRKLSFKKIGRGLKKLGKNVVAAAPIAAGFLPGVGSLVQSGIGLVGRGRSGLEDAAARWGLDPQDLLGFARSYGWDMGDPGPPKAQKKRKSAGAGPKHKASQKRQVRARRAAKAAPVPKKGGGVDWDAVGRAAAGAGTVIAGAVGQRYGMKPVPDFSDFDLSGITGKKGGFRMGGRRRSMNPANVKALRRGIRRLEGFEKLVARVHKSMPRTRALINRARGGRGGHRAGCRCVACKRAA